jgi:hypothetical protein
MMEVSSWAQGAVAVAQGYESKTPCLRPPVRSHASRLKFRANKLLKGAEILHNQLLATPQWLDVRNIAPAESKFQNSNEQTIETRNFFS